MSAALLIIDVQRALCEGPEAGFEAARVVSNINAVARRVRASGLPVVLIQHEELDGSLRHGSPGWEMAPGLEVCPPDIRLRKTAPDAFHDTGLQALLQQRGVTELIVCGLQTDFCIDTTTRRALALGFPVVLVADAHTTVANGVLEPAQIIAHHNRTLAAIGSFGPRVLVLPASQVHLPSGGGLHVVRLTHLDERQAQHLSALLIDTVAHDGSVGFLTPLSPASARQYWQRVAQSLDSGLSLWVAEQEGQIVGTVQLEACQRPNGLHRAELQKLMVHSTHRRRGIGSALLAHAERFAADAGLSLLVLDTQQGSVAESLYQHHGWRRAGTIPDYAMTPRGELRGTVHYYKLLAA
jgi:nicotinamidase-related amidase/GNAT superfamily N-acetyltransferase